MIIHVYKVAEQFEVHVPDHDQENAMRIAINAVKKGEVAAMQRPDTGYLALIPGKQDPVTTPKAPTPQEVISKLLSLSIPLRIKAVETAGLLDPTDKPKDDPAKWVSKVLNRASQQRKLHALLTSIEQCTTSSSS